MKALNLKIGAFLLSVIVVFSAITLGLSTHFCDDEMVAVSYFGNTDTCVESTNTCCIEEKKPTFSCNELFNICDDAHISQSPCCTSEVAQTETSLFHQIKQGNKNTETFAAILLENLTIFKNYKTASFYKKNNYQPPKLVPNLQVVYQSFLI